jgi:hypothetical protein
MSLAVNEFLGNLYADLRDRHLLPVVALLVVGIVAVPILLRTNASTAPPASTAALAAGETSQATPAVLIDAPGLREYRGRLERLETKNPFHPEFALPPVGDAAVRDVSGTSDVDGSTPPSTPGDSGLPPVTRSASGSSASFFSGSSDVSAPSSSSAATPPVDVGSPPSEPATAGGGGGSGDGETAGGWHRYSYRIDVVVGRAGEAEPQEGVKRLDVLPSRSRPVLIFMGVTEDEKAAIFAVSEDVTATSGDGLCHPTALECEFLRLKVGQAREFEYAGGGAADGNYALRLKAIERVVVERVEDPESEDAGRAQSVVLPRSLAPGG